MTITVLILLSLLLFIRKFRHRPRDYSSFFDSLESCLISHRGYGKRGKIAENTIEAVRASTDQGFTIHEIDVRVSKDNIPILFHGPKLQMTTSGLGRIETQSYENLKKINWGTYLEDKKNYKISTLKELLKSQPSNIIFNIEIKRDWYQLLGKEKCIVDIVKPYKNVFFSSFNLISLLQIRRYLPDIGIGLLITPGFLFRFRLWLYQLLILPDFIHAPQEVASESFIREMNDKGYNTVFWPVNEIEKAKQIINWKSKFVITDNIDLIKDKFFQYYR